MISAHDVAQMVINSTGSSGILSLLSYLDEDGWANMAIAARDHTGGEASSRIYTFAYSPLEELPGLEGVVIYNGGTMEDATLATKEALKCFVNYERTISTAAALTDI